MKKRLLVKLALIALLGACVFVAWLWWTKPVHSLPKSVVERIKKGMTEEEVLAVIGFSDGDYTTGPVRLWGEGESKTGKEIHDLFTLAAGKCWVTDSGVVTVTFGNGSVITAAADGRVMFCEHIYFIEPLPNRLRRGLHLD